MATQKKSEEELRELHKQLSITSSKKEYQTLWKGILIVVIIIFIILSHKMYLFQVLPLFNDVRRGTFSDLIIYGLPFALVFGLFDKYWHHLFDKWVERNYLTLARYTDQRSKKSRSFTIVKWSYSVIFYVLTSFSGVYLIKDTTFFPQFLGGHGSIFSLTQNRFLQEATVGMSMYYIVQFGKHFSRFFTHVFIKAEGNFYEYVLHHSLSTFLIIFSYTMNMWIIGIFVLVIHDYTDFGLILARAYKDYRHRKQWLLTIFYTHATVSWIGLRILVFNYCCVYATWYQLIVDAPAVIHGVEEQVMYLPYAFMCLMLTGLQIMHLFWTYFIISSFMAVNVSEKMGTHSYD